jgi:hypothetical protein
MTMGTLKDIQTDAAKLMSEMSVARVLGTEPPTFDDITDFCGCVMDADNDACEVCSEVSDAANAFERLVNADGNFYDCQEALARTLMETGNFTIRSAREVARMFSEMAVKQSIAEGAVKLAA